MNLANWDDLQYFRHYENWGNASLMDETFLRMLDGFRGGLGGPVVISRGTQGNHVSGSAHYRGEAADVILLSCTRFLEVIFLAGKHGFTGIGYYPHWKHNNKVVGGWHFDNSTERSAMWLGILDEDGMQKYHPMTTVNLYKFKII